MGTGCLPPDPVVARRLVCGCRPTSARGQRVTELSRRAQPVAGPVCSRAGPGGRCAGSCCIADLEPSSRAESCVQATRGLSRCFRPLHPTPLGPRLPRAWDPGTSWHLISFEAPEAWTLFWECPSWQPPLWEQNAPSPGAGVPRRPARRCSGVVPGRCGGPSALTWRSRQETQVFAVSGDRSGSLGTCSDTRSGGSQTGERLMRGRAQLSRDAPGPRTPTPAPPAAWGSHRRHRLSLLEVRRGWAFSRCHEQLKAWGDLTAFSFTLLK